MKVSKILFAVLATFFCSSLQINAASLLTMNSEAVHEFYAAEKTEIDNLTNPEESLINENLSLNGYYSRPHLVKLLSGSKKILLTFDDGPHPRTTPEVLRILRQRNVKAIFFVLGVQVQKYPELIKQIHAEGHIIGNHSYIHKNLTKLSPAMLREDLNKTSTLIENLIGKKPEFLRPPYGAMNRNVIRAAQEEGMRVMLWTIDPKDWQSKNETAIMRNLDRQLGISSGDLRGGAILLHDIYPSTVRVLDAMLDRLASQEYMITSIDKLDNNSATFWAAAAPTLLRHSKFKRTFNPQSSGNPLLISLLQKKPKAELSSMALLKAQKSGNLLVYLVKNQVTEL